VKREDVNSRRVRIINHVISEINTDVTDMHERLIDKEKIESLECIESIRGKLNLLKDEILNDDIV